MKSAFYTITILRLLSFPPHSHPRDQTVVVWAVEDRVPAKIVYVPARRKMHFRPGKVLKSALCEPLSAES
jgi:hypothetical protein